MDYWPGFLDPPQARALMERLRQSIPWRQDSITLFGRTMPQPRLTQWYAEQGLEYTYSGITMQPLEFCREMADLLQRCQTAANAGLNSALVNLYRDGQDSMGWHSDDEQSLGRDPVIASVSLGAARRFDLRHRTRRDLETHRLMLEHGSLLVMSGPTQHYWQHQVPKQRRVTEPRINLTFRQILPPDKL